MKVIDWQIDKKLINLISRNFFPHPQIPSLFNRKLDQLKQFPFIDSSSTNFAPNQPKIGYFIFLILSAVIYSRSQISPLSIISNHSYGALSHRTVQKQSQTHIKPTRKQTQNQRNSISPLQVTFYQVPNISQIQLQFRYHQNFISRKIYHWLSLGPRSTRRCKGLYTQIKKHQVRSQDHETERGNLAHVPQKLQNHEMPQPRKHSQVQIIVFGQNLSNQLPRHGIPALPHPQRFETQRLNLARNDSRRDLKCTHLYAQKECVSQRFKARKYPVLRGRWKHQADWLRNLQEDDNERWEILNGNGDWHNSIQSSRNVRVWRIRLKNWHVGPGGHFIRTSHWQKPVLLLLHRRNNQKHHIIGSHFSWGSLERVW